MSVVTSRPNQAITSNIRQAYTCDLLSLYDEYKENIEVLSLDCFDTLLWRNVSRPIDVFNIVQTNKTFVKYGITAEIRINLEQKARKQKLLLKKN